MGWRSVIITQPAYLSLAVHALQIRQGEQQAQIPLEDISVLVIDHAQTTLTGQLLTACAEHQICVITVDATHHPNGVYLPFLPHTRALKVMRAQIALTAPARKQLHKALIQQKIQNQAAVLACHGHEEAARYLQKMAGAVRSGDPDNKEAQAAQAYFTALFGMDFQRRNERFHNSALNYTYAVVRATIARGLVSYGFLPAFGLFHRNEQNAFNLADDLIEPFRAFADAWVLRHFPAEREDDLNRDDKAVLVALLHEDIVLNRHEEGGACTMLAAIEAVIISLGRIVQGSSDESLNLPSLHATFARQSAKDEGDE
jgi:CRISPR-associated protein Cas1